MMIVVKGTILWLLLALLPPSLRSEGLKLVKTWDHGDQGIFGSVNGFQILSGPQVFVSIPNKPSFIVGEAGVSPVLPPGQGPGDVGLVQVHALCGDHLACLEYPLRMKVFALRDRSLKPVRSFWLEQTEYPLTPSALVHAHDKWFVAGYRSLKEEHPHARAALVSVYDAEGRLIASPLRWEGDMRDGVQHLRLFLSADGDRVWCMQEGSLRVNLFASADGALVKQANLPVPPGYRPFPEHSYRGLVDQPVQALLKGMQEIHESHSPIAALVVAQGRILVQIHVPLPSEKRYQLLIYRQADLKLQGVYPMDDLLLGARDGRYFFHRGGYPGENEVSERCVIDVYTLEGGREGQ